MWDFPTAPDGASPDDLAALTARVAALEAAPGAAEEIYTCPSGAMPRQLVYKTGSNNVVGIADASDPTKMPAIGFIASKPTSTTCVLQNNGELAGFSGLTPGAQYYADPNTPGGVSTTAGDPQLGQVSQFVGIPKTDQIMHPAIGLPPLATP